MVLDGRLELLIWQLGVPIDGLIPQRRTASRRDAESTRLGASHALDIERSNVFARTLVALLREDVAVKLTQLVAGDTRFKMETGTATAETHRSEQRTLAVKARSVSLSCV